MIPIVKPVIPMLTNETRPLLTLRLGEQYYALFLEDVIEVAAMVNLTRLPDSQAVLLGLANRHGQAVPIFDLRRVFGLSACEIKLNSLFILVQHQNQRAGLVVDEIFQVQYSQANALQWLQSSGQFIQASVSLDETLYQIIKLSTLFEKYLK